VALRLHHSYSKMWDQDRVVRTLSIVCNLTNRLGRKSGEKGSARFYADVSTGPPAPASAAALADNTSLGVREASLFNYYYTTLFRHEESKDRYLSDRGNHQARPYGDNLSLRYPIPMIAPFLAPSLLHIPQACIPALGPYIPLSSAQINFSYTGLLQNRGCPVVVRSSY
jgi:hypothetical protein